jgi:hypothetical protein
MFSASLFSKVVLDVVNPTKPFFRKTKIFFRFLLVSFSVSIIKKNIVCTKNGPSLKAKIGKTKKSKLGRIDSRKKCSFFNFCTFQDSRARRMYEESEMIRKEFQKYFDSEFPFEDVNTTFAKIKEALDKLATEVQWVPRNWVYS